jgi:NTP pyrophosphatase (non-canonical NTP hydrolase)
VWTVLAVEGEGEMTEEPKAVIVTTNGMLQAIYAHRRVWGENHEARAVDQTLEEMAELAIELLHRRRGRKSDILDEIADVLVCLDMVCDALGITRKEILERATRKAERLDIRLNLYGHENDPETLEEK